MRSFSYGHAAADDWRTAAQACLEHTGDVPNDANLGFIYTNDAFARDINAIISWLREQTGIEHWLGSVGTGICASGVEYHEQPAMAIMLAGFPDDSFFVLPAVADKEVELPHALQEWIARKHPCLGVVHGDPRNRDMEAIVEGVCDVMEGGFLVGGLSSAHEDPIQIADEAGSGGLSGVLFGPEIGMVAGLTQGCSPIGPVHEITQARGNILIELDDTPALDSFVADIGAELSRDLSSLGGEIFAGLPIRGSDTGDYMVRNLLGVDTDNKLLAIDEKLIDGRSLMFCRRDKDSAVIDMRRMLDDVKKRLPGPIKGGLYFSCLGRGPNMFGTHSEELRLIRDGLGEFPLVGFYANGEISHNRLYGYTGVLAVFV